MLVVYVYYFFTYLLQAQNETLVPAHLITGVTCAKHIYDNGQQHCSQLRLAFMQHASAPPSLFTVNCCHQLSFSSTINTEYIITENMYMLTLHLNSITVSQQYHPHLTYINKRISIPVWVKHYSLINSITD